MCGSGGGINWEDEDEDEEQEDEYREGSERWWFKWHLRDEVHGGCWNGAIGQHCSGEIKHKCTCAAMSCAGKGGWRDSPFGCLRGLRRHF